MSSSPRLLLRLLPYAWSGPLPSVAATPHSFREASRARKWDLGLPWAYRPPPHPSLLRPAETLPFPLRPSFLLGLLYGEGGWGLFRGLTGVDRSRFNPPVWTQAQVGARPGEIADRV